MNKFWTCCVMVIASLPFTAGQADDLMQVYREAVQNDPVFAQAESNWHAQKMNLPIAEAGYLPQLGITGAMMHNYTDFTPESDGYPFTSWQYNYNLTLTQQIFNLSAWEAIKGASANVKAATATYLASQQSLMQRTAQAYFNVLQAYDQLRYTIANKQAVWQQYTMAREQFRVGLIAITDEYDARSRYDQVVAQQIAAENNLNIQLENLRVITGRDYRFLSSLRKKLPLITPMPNNMEKWVSVADAQNYTIKAQSYAVAAAMDMIKQQAAGGYPSLALQANGGQARLNYPVIGNNNVSSGSGSVTQDTLNLGVQLSYNPIQGGLVMASTKQARYNYVSASAQLVQAHRQTVNQTRSSFLSVLSFMSQVKADKESIVSAKKALAATEAGFKVGTRTMVDVLNDLSAVYRTQQQFCNDQYAYINNLIALKVAAGTLSVKDLADINRWLSKPVSFPDPTNVGTVPVESAVGRDVLKTEDIDKVNEASLTDTPPEVSDRAPVVAEKKAPVTASSQPSVSIPTPDNHKKESLAAILPSPQQSSMPAMSLAALPAPGQ